MFVYLSIFFVTIAFYIYYFLNKNKTYWKDRNVAYLEPELLIGNLRDSVFRRKHLGTVIKEIYEKFPNEKVVGVYRMTSPDILIKDLDIVKQIMIKDFDNFIERGIELHAKGLGTNMFTAQSHVWLVLRNKFTPLFTSGKLKNMFHLINERGDLFMDYVKKTCATQKEQEALELVQRYTFSTISACAFGLDADLKQDKMEQVDLINEKVLKNQYFSELQMMFPGILTKIKFNIFPKVVDDFFYGIVRDVIKQRNGVPSHRKDFMDMILELRQQKEVVGSARGATSQLKLEIDEEIMAAQAFIFYIAGFETTATTLAFMLYNLALNQDIQDKVLAEIDDVLERHNGELTYGNVKEMKYMSQALDETLRLYPIGEPLQRRAAADYEVPGMDLTIRKGQVVIVSATAIQRDPKYYPDPDRFDPDRFNAENSRNRHSCAYLPFGIGPRNCIGLRFAKVQSQVCIAKLLSSFRVEPSARTPKTMEFDPYKPIIGPLGGIYLNFIPRH